ncbi:MAG: hypothetical protein IKR94_01715 [Bacteroidales bacterium]|nr:hypothetical protein [Salinivirgaceae bacterium]MBR4214020.1 hypothetical protein [Bacteroidales bacterium]
MKKPTLAKFKETLAKAGGNLTNTAAALGCDRTTIWAWSKSDDEFAAAIDNSRMKIFDRALSTAQILAFGIPEKDAEGNVVGWIDRPDGGMLRYFMGTLGRKEGFGREEVSEVPENVKSGVAIESWINAQLKGEDTPPTETT